MSRFTHRLIQSAYRTPLNTSPPSLLPQPASNLPRPLWQTRSLKPSSTVFAWGPRRIYSTESKSAGTETIASSLNSAEAERPSWRAAPHRRPNEPVYELYFTCKVCKHRSGHSISKQGYHFGTVLVQCPGCDNRHLISDHLKIFSDKTVTLEDLIKEKGESIKLGTVDAKGDVEFWDEQKAEAREQSTRDNALRIANEAAQQAAKEAAGQVTRRAVEQARPEAIDQETEQAVEHAALEAAKQAAEKAVNKALDEPTAENALEQVAQYAAEQEAKEVAERVARELVNKKGQ